CQQTPQHPAHTQARGPLPETAAPAGRRGRAMTAARRFARDRWALAGFVFLALLVVVAVAAPLVVGRVLHASPYRLGMMDKVKEGGRLVDVVSDGGIPIGPSASYPLGADLIGRGGLSRLVY